ncbi:MAG: response regulator transcription factor, partial [Clostridium sp.]
MREILLVEDDLDLSKQLSLSLEKWGFSVELIDNFSDIVKEFTEKNSSLIIMDVNLPYYDGFYWCEKIREISKVPIIFLSSRDSNMDLIMGINNGGDDYITKPFSIEVLITKINALLRRSYDYTFSDSVIYYKDT